MLVEVARGLLTLRSVALALGFGLTMRKAIACGANTLVASLGTLARSAKIDQFSHRPRWSSDVRDAPLRHRRMRLRHWGVAAALAFRLHSHPGGKP
jgi:hypothetical protein